MYEVMRDGFKVWCEASVETRVRRLLEDYGREEYREEMVAALGRIRKKLGGDKYAELSGYLHRWELEPFVRELCVSYYDRNYYKVRDWVEDAVISLEDYDEAADALTRLSGTRITAWPCTSSVSLGRLVSCVSPAHRMMGACLRRCGLIG